MAEKKINITDVALTLTDTPSVDGCTIKGLASVIVDHQYQLAGITIVQGPAGMNVILPFDEHGNDYFRPINPELRLAIDKAIQDKYRESTSKDTEHFQEGVFTSVWDGGTEVESTCKFNLHTGEITDIRRKGDDDVPNFEELCSLDEEYVESANGGTRYKVCPNCHNYIMKDTGKMFTCPDCKHTAEKE